MFGKSDSVNPSSAPSHISGFRTRPEIPTAPRLTHTCHHTSHQACSHLLLLFLGVGNKEWGDFFFEGCRGRDL